MQKHPERWGKPSASSAGAVSRTTEENKKRPPQWGGPLSLKGNFADFRCSHWTAISGGPLAGPKRIIDRMRLPVAVLLTNASFITLAASADARNNRLFRHVGCMNFVSRALEDLRKLL